MHCMVFRNSIELQFCVTFEADITNFKEKVKKQGLSSTMLLVLSVIVCVLTVMFSAFMVIGLIEIIVTQLKITKVCKMIMTFSMLLSVATVLFLALTGETYATVLAFLFFVLKVILYMKGR